MREGGKDEVFDNRRKRAVVVKDRPLLFDFEKPLPHPHARSFCWRISFVQLMTATTQHVSWCRSRNQRLEGRGKGGRG